VKIGIVAPSPVPFTRGGADRAWAGLRRAIDELTPDEAELVHLPVRERTLPEVIEGYRDFARLDVSRFDLVITSKYPAWMVEHPFHVVWMFHPLRGLYDTYHTFGMPERAEPTVDEVADLVRFLDGPPLRSELDACFELWDRALRAAGLDHPDLGLPSPVARRLVHWLDRVALSPPAVRRHLALSATVAARPGYFPPGTDPIVAHCPSDLRTRTGPGSSYFFTASRLDGPKRFDLLVDAMAHVPQDIPLLIGGAGPLADDLRARAASDRRVKLLGFVPDHDLSGFYANALAVPFVPADEDYGLITVEAMASGTPVVTCTDSGGPTELVVDGANGFVVDPTAAALGGALSALAADPARARQMGRGGRHRIAEITWASTVATILDRPLPEPTPPVVDLRAAEPAVVPAVPSRHRPKIVVLTTFEIHQPRHGGQLRCAHLYGGLAHHFDVEVLSLVEHDHQAGLRALGPGFWERAIARSTDHLELGRRTSHHAGVPVTDIVAGTEIERSPAYLEALRDALKGATLVLLAEPYLLPALEAVGSDLPWIYDAFNVEAELKAGALPRSDLGRRLAAEVVAIEGRAVSGAAAITTCSIEDARDLAQRYARPLDDFTVVPNGTDCGLVVPTPVERAQRRDRWLAKWARTTGRANGPERLAVFFGSWHPPNLAAAKVILWLAPQLPQLQFVMGGTHGDAFPEDPFAADTVPDNVVFTGQVIERVKRTLLAAADVALNPVQTGSGTNLKVIEYLAAGVPVVSTAFGIRGLDVGNGRHLLVAEPHEMVGAIEAVLADPDAADARARAGRALAVERYDWNALGRRLAQVAQGARRAEEPHPAPRP
jgi:glycosyltransferase involved in cell wall biosynthesis